MQQNDYLQVGVITSTHGIKGEVKVFPTTDDPNRFRALKDVVLDTGKEQSDGVDGVDGHDGVPFVRGGPMDRALSCADVHGDAWRPAAADAVPLTVGAGPGRASGGRPAL